MDVNILDWMSKNRHGPVGHAALNELIQETLLLMCGGRAGDSPTISTQEFGTFRSMVTRHPLLPRVFNALYLVTALHLHQPLAVMKQCRPTAVSRATAPVSMAHFLGP
jgi:hypothetical protein